MSGPSSVLVIGGGMAGVIAALAAAERGRSVRLVKKAPGATALSSGAMDLALAGGSGLLPSAQSLESRLDQVARTMPGHPYAVLGSRGREILDQAFRFVIAKLGSAGLEHAPFDSKSTGHLVIDGSGRLRRVATAQCSQVLGDYDPKRSQAGVVRLARVLGIDTGLVRAGLKSSFSAAEPVVLDWPADDDAPFLLPAELGRRLDDPQERARFSDLLGAAVAGRSLTHIVLPPIGGMADGGELMRELSRATGCKVVEILGGEASLPGLRLHLALQRALQSAGVEVRTDSARAGEGILAEHQGPLVLASGRFIGGGLERKDLIRETVLDLPVGDGSRRLLDEPSETLTSRPALEVHSLFSAGIRVDEELRPLALGGTHRRAGLFAAGAIIGGFDPHADLCGMGVAILTGYLAGLRAAEWEAA